MMTNLKPLNRQTAHVTTHYPERIVQFGAGNFLRGFVDWIVEVLNEQAGFASSIAVVKVTPNGTYTELDAQDGLFHVHLEGIQNGEPVSNTKLITCVSRCVYPYEDYESYLALAHQPEIRFIISNTTEAGIVYAADDQASDQPPSSFPAKLTLFLLERYRHFAGIPESGCVIIPTELIVDNGRQLREIVLRYAAEWDLGIGFADWVQQHNLFCNTLVDRIVSGFPQERSQQFFQELGYEDQQLVMGEPYHLWVIEAPDSLNKELPVAKTSLNIKIVSDAEPYRQTKVRILNGLHTSMVHIGYLLGLRSVRECLEHPALAQFIRDEAFHEVIPSMDLPEAELTQFARDVFDRFRNPAIHHRLASIVVNSSAKLKPRLVPTLQAYYAKYHKLPVRVIFALAVFIRFYQGEWQGEILPLSDNAAIIAWFKAQWESSTSLDELALAVLQNTTLWGDDLSQIDGLHAQITNNLRVINESHEAGILQILEQINGKAV